MSRARLLWILLAALLPMTSCKKSSSSGFVAPGSSSEALLVRETVPPDGSNDVAVDRPVAVAFSAEIDPDTVSADSFRVLQGDDPVDGEITSRGREVFFEPERPFDELSDFRLEVGTAIRSRDGAGLAAPFVVGFRTGLGESFRIVKLTPPDGAASVSPDVTVRVEFSVEVEPGSVTADTLELLENGQPVSGSVSVDGERIELIPASALGSEEDYSVRLAGTIRDLSGRELGDDRTWSFRTRETVPPTVVRISPEDESIDIEREVVVEAEFSEDLATASIRAETFRLVTPVGDTVPAKVEYQDRVATLTPNEVLLPNTVYTARLTGDITDTVGNPLEPMSWSFTTLFSGVGPADLIEDDDSGDVGEPVLTVADEEKAMAVWVQTRTSTGDIGDGFRSIYARPYDFVQSRWDDVGPVEIDRWKEDHCHAPDVGSDASGNVIAVWLQDVEKGTYTWPMARRWDVTKRAWESTEVLLQETKEVRADEIQIAFDGLGDALVVWRDHFKDDTALLWARRYVARSGNWDKPQQQSPADVSTTPRNVRVAGNPSGNGGFFIAWEAVEPKGHSDIYWAQFTSGWKASELLESDKRSAHDVSIAFAGNGDAFFTFLFETPSANGFSIFDDLVARRWAAKGGFDTKAPVEIDTIDERSAVTPSLAADEQGNAVVTWIQNMESGPGEAFEDFVLTRRYSIDQLAWEPKVPERISDSGAAPSGAPTLALRPDGIAWVSWPQRGPDGKTNLFGSRYDPKKGWILPLFVQSDLSQPAGLPVAAAGTKGASFVIWPQQGPSVLSLWGVRFP
ncbi:MAG: Ig-like domain-containing protein [Planctomycetota bacterium]